jgi:hypothetical protein
MKIKKSGKGKKSVSHKDGLKAVLVHIFGEQVPSVRVVRRDCGYSRPAGVFRCRRIWRICGLTMALGCPDLLCRLFERSMGPSLGSLGGIRRTRQSLKHEGGCSAYAIRADAEVRGKRNGARRGLTRVRGDSSFNNMPESGGEIYDSSRRGTRPNFPVSRLSSHLPSSPPRMPTTISSK